MEKENEQFYTKKDIARALNQSLERIAIDSVYSGKDITGIKEAKDIVDGLIFNLGK